MKYCGWESCGIWRLGIQVCILWHSNIKKCNRLVCIHRDIIIVISLVIHHWKKCPCIAWFITISYCTKGIVNGFISIFTQTLCRFRLNCMLCFASAFTLVPRYLTFSTCVGVNWEVAYQSHLAHFNAKLCQILFMIQIFTDKSNIFPDCCGRTLQSYMCCCAKVEVVHMCQ